MLNTLINFLITGAYAEAAPAAASTANTTANGGGGFSLTIMLVIFVFFAYFMILRPQNKRAKETQSLLNSLNKGDEIMTAGGLIGKIIKITDQYVLVGIADNVEIILQKSSVVSLLPKGTIKSLQ